jgi:hypothetical protein
MSPILPLSEIIKRRTELSGRGQICCFGDRTKENGRSRQGKRTGSLVFILLFGLAAIDPSLAAPAAGNLIVHDLIPDLTSFLRVAPTEQESRAKLFKQMVIQPHPEVYDRPWIFKTDLGTLEQYLVELKEYLPGIEEIHRRFEEQRASIQAKFLNAFPAFDSSRAKVYLMLSLFHFDGKIPHDDPHLLLLGLDGLAKFHGAAVRLPVILSHELFHVYHFQVNPLPRDADQIGLYRLIWQEGLATYVSQVLNPGASLADVLLDPRLAREGPRLIPMLAHNLLGQLETTDDATTALYLSYRRGGEIPARMGYLIGYEIAKRAAATHPVEELARLRGRALLKLVRQDMQILAGKIVAGGG